MAVFLKPHPQTPVPNLTLEVMVERKGDRLWLRFILEGDVNRIKWPAHAAPDRTNGLWVTTCFEAFVQTDDGYCEFNLSPSDQWAAFRFDSYREGKRDAAETARVDGLDGGEDYVALEAHIDLPPSARKLALSTVIEDDDGGISYWALNHPPGKPDFHHPDSFVLDLP